MRSLYVEPIGGLCNRMRCISSAYNFAKENDYEMTIIWSRKEELNCIFQQIFKPIIVNEKKIKVINLPYVGLGIVNKGHHKISEYIRSIYKKKCDVVLVNEKCDINKLKEYSNIYISTYENWADSDIFDMFVPQTKIEKCIEEYKEIFEGYMVGVHFRRTDNTVSIDNSPTDLYIKKMKTLMRQHNNCKFFIASDDYSEIENVIKEFGEDKIVYQKNIKRDRNSSDAIKNAVIDLYLLANTDEIVGSYYSSFTDVASYIYHKKRIIIKKEQFT